MDTPTPKPEDDTEAGAGLVGSVVQAMAILRYVAETPEPQGVTIIARALNISQSSCYNIIKTLVAEEFLERHERSKTYSLGPAPLDLSRRILDENGVFQFLRGEMQSLADRFSVTTTLWKQTRSERWVLLGLVESLALARIHLTVGQRLPLYSGAMGRCVAAHTKMSEHAVVSAFKSTRFFNPPSVEDYLAQVEQTRKRGWGLDENQFNQFFSSIASPIVDRDGHMRYCVTQTMFAGQHTPKEILELGEATRTVAAYAALHLYGRTAPMGVMVEPSKIAKTLEPQSAATSAARKRRS